MLEQVIISSGKVFNKSTEWLSLEKELLNKEMPPALSGHFFAVTDSFENQKCDRCFFPNSQTNASIEIVFLH